MFDLLSKIILFKRLWILLNITIIFVFSKLNTVSFLCLICHFTGAPYLLASVLTFWALLNTYELPVELEAYISHQDNYKEDSINESEFYSISSIGSMSKSRETKTISASVDIGNEERAPLLDDTMSNGGEV